MICEVPPCGPLYRLCYRHDSPGGFPARHGEHHVEVRHVEQFRVAVLEPLCSCETLTLRATVVAARVVRHALVASSGWCGCSTRCSASASARARSRLARAFRNFKATRRI